MPLPPGDHPFWGLLQKLLSGLIGLGGLWMLAHHGINADGLHQVLADGDAAAGGGLVALGAAWAWRIFRAAT